MTAVFEIILCACGVMLIGMGVAMFREVSGETNRSIRWSGMIACGSMALSGFLLLVRAFWENFCAAGGC